MDIESVRSLEGGKSPKTEGGNRGSHLIYNDISVMNILVMIGLMILFSSIATGIEYFAGSLLPIASDVLFKVFYLLIFFGFILYFNIEGINIIKAFMLILLLLPIFYDSIYYGILSLSGTTTNFVIFGFWIPSFAYFGYSIVLAFIALTIFVIPEGNRNYLLFYLIPLEIHYISYILSFAYPVTVDFQLHFWFHLAINLIFLIITIGVMLLVFEKQVKRGVFAFSDAVTGTQRRREQ